MNKRKIIILTVVIMLLTQSFSFATVDNVKSLLDVENINKYVKNTENIKNEVDTLNKNVEGKFKNVIKTKNGVEIYTMEDIKAIDTSHKEIALRQELMRMKFENKLDKYRYITFPIISEAEQFGVKADYSKELYVDDFFKDKINDEYKDSIVNYDFFKEVSLESFTQAIELLDFVNLEGVQVVFHPYKILSGYAYCETFSPDGINLRRTRTYFNPVDGEDIISTIYHELGHAVYTDFVENNPEYYELYYDIYREAFDKNDAEDRYGYWENKLTENFAEDFKIYATQKILGKNNDLDSFILSKEKSFLGKDTIYDVKDKEVTAYFDYILKEENINNGRLRPDISVSLDDYNQTFRYRDASYLDGYINKIFSNSKEISIKFEESDSAVLKVNNIKVTKIVERDRGNIYTSNEYKATGSEVTLDIKDRNCIYEVEISLGSNNYEEKIAYYIIKQ